MSLINDALKKAQRQRTEANPTPTEITAPSAAPEQLQRVARRAKPAGFRSQLLLIAGGAFAVMLALGFGAMFFFHSGGEQAAATPVKPAVVAAAPAATVTPTAAQPAPAPIAVAPAPAAPVAASIKSPPVPSPVAASTPPPAPAPAPQLVSTAPVTASGAAAAPPAPQFALPAAPVAETETTQDASAAKADIVIRPKPSTRMIGVIEHFRVGGIRMAGADSKVLMNDKVYRLNDIVDYELNIRLTGIDAKALTFEDSHGAVHVRTF